MKGESLAKRSNGTSRSIGPMFDLTGKTIVLTGGRGKLGTSWTRCLQESGANVLVWDLPDVDVTDAENVRAAGQGLEVYGIINAAALDFPPGAPPQGFAETFRVNVEGAWNVCRALMPSMTDGAVINVSSIYALVSPFWDKPPAYGASKAALVQMTKYLACFFPHLRVNSVCFGGVEGDQPDWFKEEYISRCPVGRMAQVWEYDSTILWMLTCPYLTGSNVVVDGGWTAM